MFGAFWPIWALQEVLVVKNLPANAGAAWDANSIPGWGIFPEGEQGNPYIILAQGIPGQSSLADYSPQGLKESDMTEVTAHTHNQYKL